MKVGAMTMALMCSTFFLLLVVCSVLGDDTLEACQGLTKLCQTPISEVYFAMVHNAMSSVENGFIVAANHNEDAIVEALDAGYRALSLDLCKCSGVLELCHGSASVGCGIGSVDPVEAFGEINEWVDTNPRNVLLLTLEINDDAGGDIGLEEVKDLLDSSGLSDHLYDHWPVESTEWPTVGELIDAGQQVLFFYTEGPYGVGEHYEGLNYLFDVTMATGFDWGSVEELQDAIQNGCPITRGLSTSSTQDFFMIEAFVTEEGFFGIEYQPSEEAAQVINSQEWASNALDTCNATHGKVPNIFSVDFWSQGDLATLMHQRNALLVGEDVAPSLPTQSPTLNPTATTSSGTTDDEGDGTNTELALLLVMGGAPALAHRGHHDHGSGHGSGGHHGHHGQHGHGHAPEKPSFHGPPPPGHGHEHEHEHHLAMEQLQVVETCMSDVISLCSAGGASPPTTLGDPFMDWMLLGSAEPPQDVRNVFDILEHLFDPSVLEPSVHHVTLYWNEESPQAVPAPKRLVDSVASKVAEHHQQEELPQLALDLQAFGRQAMDNFQENTLPHVVARRLTELDATQIKRPPVMLPFGPQRNDCLRSALTRNLVSSPCVKSMQALELAQSSPWLHGPPHHHHGCPHHHMVFMVFVLPTIVAILLKMYFHKAMGAKGRMHRRLVAVVYKTPSLRAQVEQELGQPLGEPMGCCQYFSQQWKKESFCTKLLVVSGLFFVVSAWIVPFAVVASCAIARRIVKGKSGCCCCCCCGATPKAARNGNLTAEQECCCCCKGTGISCEACVSGCGAGCCCSATTSNVSDDCTCCCCGATSSAALAGTLTVEQECCNCCKGTGTCSDACADCCAGGCSCDGKDCCCCADADCICCCCGATSSAARAGTLTVEQECCNCCKGTGTCSDACAACCAGGCSCDGKDCCCCVADDCTCCCCGATSTAARAGTLTVEQECCNCCKGTGTCSDACASCCAGGCSCDGEDCCCCDGTEPTKKGRGQKHVVPARKEVYEGIALQIV
eukprot:Nitzschia sp. Nitz4//scaffold210_size37948//31086//34670//NITZ4_007695-RA/size37948-processed-gene-0.51-mRNA-1//-1//CDS//3329541945//7925//frame0